MVPIVPVYKFDTMKDLRPKVFRASGFVVASVSTVPSKRTSAPLPGRASPVQFAEFPKSPSVPAPLPAPQMNSDMVLLHFSGLISPCSDYNIV